MQNMAYEIDNLPFEEFFVPVSKATAAVVRLDERISRSPIRDGMVARMHMQDAVASMWLEGELVHMEDLVLHDALMDSRMPSHALTIAHAVLRMRRQIAGRSESWALSSAGIQQLLGRAVDTAPDREIASSTVAETADADPLLDDIDSLLARTDALLKMPSQTRPNRTSFRATRCFMTMTGTRMPVWKRGGIASLQQDTCRPSCAPQLFMTRGFLWKCCSAPHGSGGY